MTPGDGPGVYHAVPHLGATLYELARGGGIAYHFHHGREELLIVLHGRLTLRTPNGSRELGSGAAVVHFPVGPEGAHAITKDDEEPVRYLMVSTLVSPDATEYPDTRQLSVYARTKNKFSESSSTSARSTSRRSLRTRVARSGTKSRHRTPLRVYRATLAQSNVDSARPWDHSRL
jgi:uncharacterized cupin superfamily protein